MDLMYMCISSRNLSFKIIIIDKNIILHLDIKFLADLKQIINQISQFLHRTEYLNPPVLQARLQVTRAFMHTQAQQEHSAIYHHWP